MKREKKEKLNKIYREKIKSAGAATADYVCNNEWVAWRSLYTWGPLSCMQFV